MPESFHSAYLLIGSNIEPVANIRKTLIELCHFGIIKRISHTWQTPSYGSQGPDFINLAIEFITPLSLEELKKDAIGTTENSLGRYRTKDKNAPRTIDLDIIIFDDILLDQTIWSRVYIAIPLAELQPDLTHPISHIPLSNIANDLVKLHPIRERKDILTSGK